MQNPPSAQAGFTEMYTGNPPWEIGKPQPPFIAAAEQVTGPLLDVGCGTGNTALFFAARGLQVTGIDFVETAIARAQAKAAERDLSVEFLLKDAMTLDSWHARFASVIDSGLFHIYHGDEQRRYVDGLAHVIVPGGRLFLYSFSKEDPWKSRPESGVSREELCAIFADGWEIESMELVRGELNPAFLTEFPDECPDGCPKGWFAIIRRQA